MANKKKLLDLFNEAQEPAERSRYLLDGTHILRVHNVETIETQSGNELMFVEYLVLDTKGTRPTHIIKNDDGEEEEVPLIPHEVEDIVKQSFPITGAAGWQIKKSMAFVKRLARITNGVRTMTEELLSEYIGEDGAESPLIGYTIKAVGTRETTQNMKEYTRFTYSIPKEKELEALKAEAPTEVEENTAPTSKEEVTSSQTEEVSLSSDEEPEF